MFFVRKNNRLVSNVIKCNEFKICAIVQYYINQPIMIVFVKGKNKVYEIPCEQKYLNRVIHKINKGQFQFLKEM